MELTYAGKSSRIIILLIFKNVAFVQILEIKNGWVLWRILVHSKKEGECLCE